jgi:hypothetical protein
MLEAIVGQKYFTLELHGPLSYDLLSFVSVGYQLPRPRAEL